MVKVSDKNLSKATTPTDLQTVDKVSVVDSHSPVVETNKIGESSDKLCSLVGDQSDDSISIVNASMADDEQDSDLDVSHVSIDELGKTTLSDKASIQRQDEREKKRLEKLREKEVNVIIVVKTTYE